LFIGAHGPVEGMASNRSVPMSINREPIVAEGAVFGDLIECRNPDG